MEQSSCFKHYAHLFTEKDLKKNAAHPFKDHAQIPFIADILNRQQQHHILLISNASEKINFAFAEGIAQHLVAPNASKSLRDAYFIYFDAALLALTRADQEQIKHSLHDLANELHVTNKRVVFIINQIDPLLLEQSHLALHALCHFLPDDAWRIVAFARQAHLSKAQSLKNYFAIVHLSEPSKTEQLALLKTFRPQLEDFHHAIISDETFSSAYSLAEHYLAGESSFDKALELLDSAAARASVHERQDQTGHKPIVTTNLLTQVVSCWSQIPFTHLQNNKFQAAKFLDAVRKQIFGQDPAVNHIATLLQNACTQLQKSKGPLCSFLFVGPSDSGKTETAFAIAEHLFGHRNALLHVNMNKTHYSSLADIKITPRKDQNYCLSLLEAIQQTPFAVVLIENIDLIERENFDLFHDIFTQGYVIDKLGNKFDFHHAIFIMTTQATSEHIHKLSTVSNPQESNKAVDLMQLILNDNFAEQSPHLPNQYSPQELCDELFPKLSQHFPLAFLQRVNTVPFTNLDYAALEKIIRAKVKALARRLEASFGIEINFAPEAIKFLAHETLWRKPNNKSIEKSLELHLYSCISHEILLYAEDKNRPKRLLVQLNDNGQLLRCETISSKESTLYNL